MVSSAVRDHARIVFDCRMANDPAMMPSTNLDRYKNSVARIVFWLGFKAPIILLGFVGYAYTSFLVVRFEEDTTPITNTAFAIIATLAALSFSFARVAETEALRDRLAFAGERFLHGALLILVASILKCFVFLVLKIPNYTASPIRENATYFTMSLVGRVFFGYGFLFAHTGLRALNDLLLTRMARHKDWDNLW